jgi:hypothetical protein
MKLLSFFRTSCVVSDCFSQRRMGEGRVQKIVWNHKIAEESIKKKHKETLQRSLRNLHVAIAVPDASSS